MLRKKITALSALLSTTHSNIETFTELALVLLNIFERLAPYFPKGKKLNILSLGCGVPVEYIALLAFYAERSKASLSFTGIDINDKVNTSVRQIFAPIAADSFRVLTCDGSRIDTLHKALLEAKCSPKNGFDLVVLRQPDIYHRTPIFSEMLRTVIPFFSSKKSQVFISCYSEEEISRIGEITRSKGLYFKPGPDHYCKIEKQTEYFIEGAILKPDSASVILDCDGLALAKENTTGTGQVAKNFLHFLFNPSTASNTLDREMKTQLKQVKKTLEGRFKLQ